MKWKPRNKNLSSADEQAVCPSGEDYSGSKEIVGISMESSRNNKERSVGGVQLITD